jgi:hypothetical protein
MTVNPGDVVTDYVSVSNLGTQPLTLAVYASDAFNTQQGGFDLLAADKPSVDVGAWVKFDVQTVTVPARGTSVVPFKLTVPQNAQPGDHVGGIVASRSRPGQDGAGNQVKVDYRVGARIYLRVQGTLAPKLEIEDLSVNYDSSFNPLSGGAMTVHYTVTNSGNVRLSAGQELSIKGPFGVGLKTVKLDDMPELLPGATHEGSATIDGVHPALRLSTEFKLSPVADGTDMPSISAISGSSGLWAFPVTIVAIVLIVAVLGYLNVRGLMRGFRAGRDA